MKMTAIFSAVMAVFLVGAGCATDNAARRGDSAEEYDVVLDLPWDDKMPDVVKIGSGGSIVSSRDAKLVTYNGKTAIRAIPRTNPDGGGMGIWVQVEFDTPIDISDKSEFYMEWESINGAEQGNFNISVFFVPHEGANSDDPARAMISDYRRGDGSWGGFDLTNSPSWTDGWTQKFNDSTKQCTGFEIYSGEPNLAKRNNFTYFTNVEFR